MQRGKLNRISVIHYILLLQLFTTTCSKGIISSRILSLRFQMELPPGSRSRSKISRIGLKIIEIGEVPLIVGKINKNKMTVPYLRKKSSAS